MDIDKLFASLDLDELLYLQEQLALEIYMRRKTGVKTRREEACKTVEQIAREYGFTVEDLLNKPAATRKVQGKLKPAQTHYEHPDDPRLSWSGRGRKPWWIVDLLNKGVALKDLEREIGKQAIG